MNTSVYLFSEMVYQCMVHDTQYNARVTQYIICTYVCMYVRMRMYVCMYVCMYACMYLCIYVCYIKQLTYQVLCHTERVGKHEFKDVADKHFVV